MSDNDALVELRLDVSRIARALGLEHEITNIYRDEGWSRLCESIIDAIQRRACPVRVSQ